LTTAESAKSADIALVIYGDHGNSGLIILGSSGSKGLFQSGNTDEFKVKIHSFIHSFIQTISIAPLQVHFYSEALLTQHGYCAGVSRRSASGNCELRTCTRSLRGG